MKKTLIALLLVGTSSALFAQTVTSTTDENTNTADNTITTSVSTGSYPAYGTVAVDVPTTVRYSFQRDYPMVTTSQWYLTPNGQYRVIYKDNMNQDMDVYYYGTSAQSFLVALPVRQSLTPEDIVSTAKNMFGLSVYDINRVRAANMDYVYHVRLLDNGQVRSVWLNEQGSEVAAADVFRTSVVVENDVINEINTTTSDNNAAMSTDDNSTDTKIKIKSSDGTKTKYKDGEIKTK
jgi:hypothetical protein